MSVFRPYFQSKSIMHNSVNQFYLFICLFIYLFQFIIHLLYPGIHIQRVPYQTVAILGIITDR